MNRRPFLSVVLLLLSILLFVSEGFAQGGLSQKSEKDQRREKGLEQKERDRIKTSGIYSMSIWKYEYSFGKPDKKGVQVSTARYNTQGNKVEETVNNAGDGNVFTKTNYRYDRRGNLIEEVKAKGESKTKTVFRYDTTDRKREMVGYKADGTVERKALYMFDEANNMVESLGYLADGRLYSRETFVYDSCGNVIENKTSLARFTYDYNDDGDMVEMVKYGRDFQNQDSLVYRVSDRMTFDYDSVGNLRSTTVFKTDGSIKAKSIYEYDAKSNVIEEVESSSEGRAVYKVSYKYDRRRNVIEDFGVEKSRPFKNTYKFDRMGNRKEWIAFDRVNEPKVLTKYIYEKYSTQKNAVPSEPGSLAEFIQPDTSEAHVMNEDLFQFLGCRIIGSDGTYLGLVWADTSHPHSITNAWGQYGFDGSPTSIFNPNSPYGGLKGVFSPFNQSCPSPPSLYREGKFVSYLSDNPSFNPRVPASRLMTFLMQQAKGRE
jgi:hypothetical protein